MAKTTDIEKGTPSAPSVSSTSPSIESNQKGNSAVPFIPASLTVSNLRYEITVKATPREGEKPSIFKRLPNVKRALLSNIAAKATPGR
ncbi:hypothetical protein BGZ65_011512, partial [Modicella reniformis]